MAMKTASMTTPCATQIRPSAATRLRTPILPSRSHIVPKASNTENDSYQVCLDESRGVYTQYGASASVS